MTVFNDIEAALNARLDSLAGSTDVAWQNDQYKPVLGTSYLRPTVLPAETFGATIGPSSVGSDNNSGIYQIDIFTKAGVGGAASRTLADSIADHFKPGTELTYNSQLTRCISVSQLSPIEGKGWYHRPIEIRYLAITIKR